VIFQSLDLNFKHCKRGILSQIKELSVNYIQNNEGHNMGLKQKIKSIIQDCSICNKIKSNKEETKY